MPEKKNKTLFSFKGNKHEKNVIFHWDGRVEYYNMYMKNCSYTVMTTLINGCCVFAEIFLVSHQVHSRKTAFSPRVIFFNFVQSRISLIGAWNSEKEAINTGIRL